MFRRGRLWLCLLAAAASKGWAECKSACNRNGYCSSAGPSGVCVCDVGFTGPSCELAHCPRGDDPETTGQTFRTIELRTFSTLSVFNGDSEKLGGMLEFSFLNESVLMPAAASELNNAVCSHAISSLRGIKRAVCERSSIDKSVDTAVYLIQFIDWAVDPVDAVLPHLGNPPLAMFGCSTTQATGFAACNLADAVSQNVREHVECSNHGTCDRTSGKCRCTAGWYGQVCDKNDDSAAVETLSADGPLYTGTILRLTAARVPDASFSLLEGYAGTNLLFGLDGAGALHVAGRAEFKSSLAVSKASRFEDDLEIGGRVKVHGRITLLSGLHMSLPVNEDDEQIWHGQEKKIGSPALRIGNLLQVVPRRSGTGSFGSMVLSGDFAVREVSIVGRLSVADSLLDASDGTIHIGGNATVLGHLVACSSLKVGILRQELGSECAASFILDVGSPSFSECNSKWPSQKREMYDDTESNSPGWLRIGGGVLEVKGREMKLRGRLLIENGGIAINGGGLYVAGGVKVEGGLRLLTGKLVVDGEGGMEVERGGFTSTTTGTAGAALMAVASNSHFTGSVLVLEGPHISMARLVPQQFNLIEGRRRLFEKPVFEVDSDGRVKASGLAIMANLAAFWGGVSLAGPILVKRTSLRAGGKLVVRSDASLVEIEDDGLPLSKTIITILDNRNGYPVHELHDASLFGRILVIANSDADDVIFSDSCRVPGQSVAVLVQASASSADASSRGWMAVSTGGVPLNNFADVGHLGANNDIDIGDVEFTSRSLRAADLRPRGLVFVGPNHTLKTCSDSTLEFDEATHVLSVTGLRARSVHGPVEMNGYAIRHSRLEATSLIEADLVSARIIRIEDNTKYPPAAHDRLLLLGSSGEVSTCEQLYYDRVRNELHIPTLAAHTVDGIVNFVPGAELRGAKISGGSIKDIQLLSVQALQITPHSAQTRQNKNTIDDEQFAMDGISGVVAVFDANNYLSPAKLALPRVVEQRSDRGELEALLITNALSAGRFASDVDFESHVLRNASLEAGSAAGLDFVIADAVLVSSLQDHPDSLVVAGLDGSLEARPGLAYSDGALNVRGSLKAERGIHVTAGDTVLGGSLLVSGSVMGSGPYVDSSDARCKTNLRVLDQMGALNVLTQLQAYIYDDARTQGISQKDTDRASNVGDDQLGFLAQDVLLSEFGKSLVKHDKSGFYYLAYARFAPVLMAALKALADINAHQSLRLSTLEAKVSALESHFVNSALVGRDNFPLNDQATEAMAAGGTIPSGRAGMGGVE